MLRSKLRAVLLGAPMCFVLASCSTSERGDRSSSEPVLREVLQEGSSQSSPATGQAHAPQPAPIAWPGPNVGNPISLTEAPGQGSGASVALSGAGGPPGSSRQYQAPNPKRLVEVDLKKLRRGIARKLHVDAGKVPATLQLPVSVAASLCGIDASALAAPTQPGGGNPACLASDLEMATGVVEPSIE